MKTIFDFGMFDGSDTEYFLEEGFRVVAVEANPVLVARAQKLLARYLDSKQLEIVHAAINKDGSPMNLTICGDDLGSSSIDHDRVIERTPLGQFNVPGITVQEIIRRHGVPHYLKIDLEGMDETCVRALTSATRPDFLSFEVEENIEGLVDHLGAIGYTRFKLINQTNFRELANQQNVRDRVAWALMRRLGFAEPTFVRRGGRYFRLGHSSGPLPWRTDGDWSPSGKLVAAWNHARTASKIRGWYDLHAN